MDQTTQAWLALQCRFIKKTVNGLVLLGPPGLGPYELMAQWPEDKPAKLSLESYSKKLLESKPKNIAYRIDRSGKFTIIACPIIVGSMCFGIITLMVEGADKKNARETGRFLEWGCEWFAWLAKERKHTREKDDRLLGFVELLALALKHEDLQKSAQVVVDSLRQRIACERVSLGVVAQQHIKLVAISDTRSVTELPALVKPVQNAMEEAFDQRATMLVTPETSGDGQVNIAHRQLLKDHQIDSVCTIPMIHNETVVGAITLEGLSGNNIDDKALRFCEQVALLLGPIVRLKNQAKQNRSIKSTLLGGKRSVKVAGVFFVAAILSSFVIEGRYEITASAQVESQKKQLVSASQNGFVESVRVRPGDKVETGQVLATLDSRDLLLEKKKWEGKKTQYIKAYNNALGTHDRVQINVLRAQLDQAAAQISLLDNQLERLTLTASIDGVILSGDLAQSLGAPVKRGDVLYEIATLDNYQLNLEVDERNVVDLQLGQQGFVLLSSLPKTPLPFRINKITPVASTHSGRNYFQVKAALEGNAERVSSGMTGIAKIEVDSRPLMWIWFHSAYDWLTLWFWRL
jgi:multidrug resistance efflux pump